MLTITFHSETHEFEKNKNGTKTFGETTGVGVGTLSINSF